MVERPDPLEMRVSLRTPHGQLRQRAALGLVIGGAVLFASTYPSRLSLGLQGIGAAILGFAAWLAWGAARVRGWKDFGVRLSSTELEAPVRPLSRRETRTLGLEDVEMVSYAAAGGGPRMIVLAHQDVIVLPFEWFPPEHPATELALRVHVRSQLLRSKASLEADEIAATEATMLAGKAYGALVITPVGGAPEVVATFDSDEERDRVEAENKGRGARVIDCRQRIAALRDALERGLSAPEIAGLAASGQAKRE